jgi:glucose/arabinose dehydrogenase
MTFPLAASFVPSCISAICIGALVGPAFAQEADTNVTMSVSVLQPTPTKPDEAFRKSVKLPPGFRIDVFAEELMNSRMIAVHPQTGAVYVSRREQGDLLLLKDTNGDGKADTKQVVAERPKLHGIAIHKDKLFFVTVNDVYVSTIAGDGTLKGIERIIDDLPDGGQHQNRTLAVGPDEKLYISCGSTCNACEESSAESATILQSSLDGKSRTIYASGLRNTIGFGWHPKTGQLWGMDHGIDWLGDELQPEELNKIDQGNRYGWPFIYADGKFTPQRQPSDGTSQETWRKLSTEPALLYTAHAAPMQMAFYTADAFGPEFKGDAFVAMRGSWNRNPPAGYEVLRIHFDDAGKPQKFEPFASGWLQQQGDDWKQFGRLAGCAVAKDGSLLVSDDKNGVIYRIWKDANSSASR